MISAALSADEFHTLLSGFKCLPPNGRLALAVSGGPDSMALASLAKRWSEQHNFPVPLALIVDHALRPESGAEAEAVKARLEALGLGAEILRWNHAPITSRLHHEARQARYGLMLDACQCHGITHLLFAHQREDQAETILMRLAKGTGVDGLAGIPAQTVMEGVHILRPLLNVPKDRLIATCEEARISYVTDPSNVLEKFARGRLRRVMPMLAEEGLTVERLVDLGVRAAEAKTALEHFTSEFLQHAAGQGEFGVVSLRKDSLLAAPRAVALRALSEVLQIVHREEYAPTHASLSNLLNGFKVEENFTPRTLNGCFVSERQGQIMIAREFNSIVEEIDIRAGESVIWDGRWRVTLPDNAGAETYTVKALGNPPHAVLDRLAPDLRHKVPQGRVRATLPALWQEGEIVFLPHLNRNRQSQAELIRPPKISAEA